ncbi:MAG: S-formylglutathione hydrolase [Thermohalobaculum sp.]|nr:S-formylglutathione hydrolase [Thermohalobaculum sp.]
METVSETTSHGGVQGVYRHRSAVCACDMTFAVYLPPQARQGRVPVVWYLSGLTCTHENAMTKAGLQAHAALHGVAVVYPDTSPRGEGVANDDAYDLGQGAGFYVNATEAPWAAHYRMYDYIVTELPALIGAALPLDMERQGITGHSMGGHGALTIALRNPGQFRSLSAFAPIAHPSDSDWGRKQLGTYLGADPEVWKGFDACLLLADRGWHADILVDQGAKDQFLHLLKPESLAGALAATRTPSVFRMQPGYDHSYFFVESFGADHIAWHAERLGA